MMISVAVRLLDSMLPNCFNNKLIKVIDLI